MKTIRVLILEDDLETLSMLLGKLHQLEEKLSSSSNPKIIAITVLSEYTQVEEYINRTEDIVFDIVLLDRDCKMGGSFHVLDIQKIGVDKIIGISSIPPYNDELSKFGVTKIVTKNYSALEEFSNTVIDLIERRV